MPEHDLEPPRFSRRALERLMNDWNAVRAMMMSGYNPSSELPMTDPNYHSNATLHEDQVYLNSQSGTAHLDKFTHCLLVKCSIEVSESVAKGGVFGDTLNSFCLSDVGHTPDDTDT